MKFKKGDIVYDKTFGLQEDYQSIPREVYGYHGNYVMILTPDKSSCNYAREEDVVLVNEKKPNEIKNKVFLKPINVVEKISLFDL